MPVLQYFRWVGSLLLVALFAVNWCYTTPIAQASRFDVPLNQKIKIRIHTDHKWPERVEFDMTRSRLAHEATVDPEITIAASDTFAWSAELAVRSPK